MKLKRRYLNWIDHNISNALKNKKILVIGATGCLSRNMCYYLAYLGNDITIVGRNNDLLNKLKMELLEINNNIEINILIVDFNNISSIDELIINIKNLYFDVVFNGIGIFYQPLEIDNNIDKTFKVNYLSYVYFFEKLLKYENYKNTRYVFVDSISYRFQKVSFDDIQYLNNKNLMKRYGNTKLLLAHYAVKFCNDGYNVTLCHPGVVATNLFSSKSNKFNKFLIPIMKLIFMKEDKASLSFLKACDDNTHKPNEWIGPRGLFYIWGYPNIQKMKKSYLNINNVKKIYDLSNELLKEFNK